LIAGFVKPKYLGGRLLHAARTFIKSFVAECRKSKPLLLVSKPRQKIGYPARIILLSAMRLALTTYPTGSTGAATTIVQSIFPPLGLPINPPFQ